MDEELLNKLEDIGLAISIKTASMERATIGVDRRINNLVHDLKVLKEHRLDVIAPFMIEIAEDKRRISKIKTRIGDFERMEELELGYETQ